MSATRCSTTRSSSAISTPGSSSLPPSSESPSISARCFPAVRNMRKTSVGLALRRGLSSWQTCSLAPLHCFEGRVNWQKDSLFEPSPSLQSQIPALSAGTSHRESHHHDASGPAAAFGNLLGDPRRHREIAICRSPDFQPGYLQLLNRAFLRRFHMHLCCTAQDCGRDKPDPCNSARCRWEPWVRGKCSRPCPAGKSMNETAACFRATSHQFQGGCFRKCRTSPSTLFGWTALGHLARMPQPRLSALCAPQHHTWDLVLPCGLRSVSNINFSAWLTTLPNLAVFMVVSTMDSRIPFTPCMAAFETSFLVCLYLH